MQLINIYLMCTSLVKGTARCRMTSTDGENVAQTLEKTTFYLER